MSHGRSDKDYIDNVHNFSRFCMENKVITWLGLFVFIAWGIYGFKQMPQRKDPDIPSRKAKIVTQWPGNTAEKVELLVTKQIEDACQQNDKIDIIETTSRPGYSEVKIEVAEYGHDDPAKVWADVKIKLDNITGLPPGLTPQDIQFNTDFGDTLALMLSVATPPLSEADIELTAKPVQAAIERVRAQHPGKRSSVVYVFPQDTSLDLIRQGFERFLVYGKSKGFMQQAQLFEGPNFVGVDFASDQDEQGIQAGVADYIEKYIKLSELHPDAWKPCIIQDPSTTLARLIPCAGDKYSYKQLDLYTELIQNRFKAEPMATKVSRTGVLNETVYLDYSQERLASYGMSVLDLSKILNARNISGASGGSDTGPGGQIIVQALGEFKTAREIGDVAVAKSNGAPVYLRDLVNIVRTYQLPATQLTYLTYKSKDGKWLRARANVVDIQMRKNLNINEFARHIDAALEELKPQLPADLIIQRTSNQPQQVEESVGLFSKCLEEAIELVVLVSLIGFWEWRSALLMALAIPITLAMTFCFMNLLQLDIQQVSIASLIIALGLLVDDPVVAGDAIKHSLSAGNKAQDAAWLGPTKLATAILYATITNIVAYLPLMGIKGDTGKFLYSLPLVIGSSLVASRLSSMSFIPLLGYYILRPSHEPPVHELRKKQPYKTYYFIASHALDNRWTTLFLSFIVLGIGGLVASQMKTEFFPRDLQHICFADIFLPSDSSFEATNRKTVEVEHCFEETLEKVGKDPPHEAREHEVEPDPDELQGLTSFVGGGAPRFWSSLDPESPKLNYCMLVAVIKNKTMTRYAVGPVQADVEDNVTGAQVDVRQLESGKPVGWPIKIRVYGGDGDLNLAEMRKVAEEIKQAMRNCPLARRIRDNWYDSILTLDINIDSDKANLSGVTNADCARAIAAALNGSQMGNLREGHRLIPIVARMRASERTQVEALKNLYVFSTDGKKKILLGQVATVAEKMQPQTIYRRQYHRCIEVGCQPATGHLASEVFKPLEPMLKEIEKRIPDNIKIQVGGEHYEQVRGFNNLVVVLMICVSLIYLALLSQFKNAIKPLVVFAAIPYGMVGALIGLWYMGTPFGFMAFLGCTSLVGVIVSHVIVLFDYIEEMHAAGENMRDALLDAGVARLRPVFITVGATVIALFPLAKGGGPLWEPLCYTQIGGLSLATMVTLVLVPVIYTIAVKDLKVLSWEGPHHVDEVVSTAAPAPEPKAEPPAAKPKVEEPPQGSQKTEPGTDK